MPQTGIQSVTVPGAVDGWQKLVQRLGRKSLKEDLAPAIRYAEEGFPVPEWAAAYWAGSVGHAEEDGRAHKFYLPKDHAPKVGDVFATRSWRRR